MDNDTRRFSGADPARVEEPVSNQPVGAPTMYLPPAGAAPQVTPTNGTQLHGGYVAPPRTTILNSNNSMAALVLIGLGLFLLLGTGGHVLGSAIPLVIGLVFLYVYNQSHKYGYLVPGAIMTGLGAGIVLETATSFGGGAVPLGLGLGFVALWVIHRAQWWWLIPGGILSLVGLDLLTTGFADGSGTWVPLVLIGLGIYALTQRRHVRHQ